MKALVTGGGGFLGKAIVTKLLDRGDQVVSLSRGDYPDLRRVGVEVRQGDIANPEVVTETALGCDIIFHVAAKAGVWGPYAEYYRTNVIGTQNVIQACQVQGISRLVYTSSPSVVFDGRDQKGINESVSYPDKYLAHYPRTKSLAEQLVRQANSPTLATVALRPHLIWGPGDNHLVPRLIARAKAGRLMKVKGGPYLVDAVYIDNAAHAHLLAADRLTPGAPLCGQAYFISQGEPLDLGELMDGIIATAGLGPITRHISPKVLYWMGYVLEILFTMLRFPGEPPMTRFVAKQLATAHWFDLSAARRDLDYTPLVSTKEGWAILKAHWNHQSKHNYSNELSETA